MSAACNPLAAMPEPSAGNWLAIDYGERTIGVAVGHPLTGSAQPLAPIRNTSKTHLEQALRSLIKQWQPGAIIVGLPLDHSGQETSMSRRIRGFANWLAGLTPDTRIHLQDERLSSEHAAREFASRRRAGRARQRDAARLDSVAAAKILESWMSEQGND